MSFTVTTQRQYIDATPQSRKKLFGFGDVLYVGDEFVTAATFESQVADGGHVLLTQGRFIISANQTRVEEEDLGPIPSGLIDPSNPDNFVFGTITRDGDGLVTTAQVTWPDGGTGIYTPTYSTDFPGAVDSYVVTYTGPGGNVTYTQPSIPRDSSGVATSRPAIVPS